ncbi:MAG: cytochrome P450 [Vicinamibacterales bacterium]|nr:cytochrome P450 [Vicinamibacterales bacterium]
MPHSSVHPTLPDALPDFARDPFAWLRSQAALAPVQRFRFGSLHGFMVGDPGVIIEVLRDIETFAKGPYAGQQGLGLMLGDGPVTSDGARWRGVRRILQPEWTAARAASAPSRFAPVLDDWCAGWDARADSGAPFDLLDDTRRWILRAVLREFLDDETCGGFEDLVEVVTRAEDGMGPAWLYLMANLSPAHVDRFRQGWTDGRARLDRVLYAIIDAQAASASTMVGRLLAGPALAEVEPLEPRRLLRDLIATIVLAGTGTTASALYWVLYLLALHPAASQRLRDELAADPPSAWSDVIDRNRYPWLDACVQETLRLYPSVWFFDRLTTRPTTLAGVDIPDGAVVLLSNYALHRQPTWFPSPDAFQPERFLAAPPVRGSYLPFGFGPRYCMGAPYALQEIAMASAAFVTRFDIDMGSGDPTPQLAATGGARPRKPVAATLRRRAGA